MKPKPKRRWVSKDVDSLTQGLIKEGFSKKEAENLATHIFIAWKIGETHPTYMLNRYVFVFTCHEKNVVIERWGCKAYSHSFGEKKQ